MKMCPPAKGPVIGVFLADQPSFAPGFVIHR
jgi:hypothetical protein